MPDPNVVLKRSCRMYVLREAFSVAAGRLFHVLTARVTLRGPLFLSKTIMFATLFTCFLLTVFCS
jgi:hypothetical protein